MTDAAMDFEHDDDGATEARRSSRLWRVVKIVAGLIAAFLLLLVVVFFGINTQPGKRLLTDIIADQEISGLKFEVGRIEGSIYGSSTLHDVTIWNAPVENDDGTFQPREKLLYFPEVGLDWNPLSFVRPKLSNGRRELDIETLALRRGTMFRRPNTTSTDGGPPYPAFDVSIDNLVVDQLTVTEGVLGDRSEVVGLTGNFDLIEGDIDVDLEGDLSGSDTFLARVESNLETQVFDVALRYDASAEGVLAGIAGTDRAYSAVMFGDGDYENWNGGLALRQDGERLGLLKLGKRGERWNVLGNLYPGDVLTGLPGRAAGGKLAIAANVAPGVDGILEGSAALRGRGVEGEAAGAVDLAERLFDNVAYAVRLRDPALLGPDYRFEDTRVAGTIDGAFDNLFIDHILTASRLAVGEQEMLGVSQSGTARYDGSRWTLPLDLEIDRLRTGTELADPRLVDGTLRGTLVYTGRELLADDLAVRFPGLTADLALRGDIPAGSYQLAGSASGNDLALENLGLIDAEARSLRFALAPGQPWRFSADLSGRMTRIDNDTLADLTGGNLRFTGGLALGGNRPIVFDNAVLRSAKLNATLDGRIENGTTAVAGRGSHTDYGDFTVQAALDDSGPRAQLVFAEPVDGFTDVAVALSPIPEGFEIVTSGGSPLGPFDGTVNFYSSPSGPSRIDIAELTVMDTQVAGALTLADGGVAGDLALAGGGVDGTIALAPRAGGQGFDVDLTADNARFGSAVSIASADIDASGVVGGGSYTVTGSATASGLQYNNLYLAQFTADAQVVDGQGTFSGALAGRRGSRFALQFDGEASTERVAVALRGQYAGRDIRMPRRAVLARTAAGGWQLEPTQLDFAGGRLLASGRFGGEEPAAFDLGLSDLPLSLVDVAGADLGLGGRISGRLNYTTGPDGLPTGDARVKIDGLSRSGLVLTSRPVDLSLVAQLTPTRLDARAILDDPETGQAGRVQARISNLPGDGGLVDRLNRGALFAQLRYDGPAAALWRLAALDAFDISGPLSVSANATGTLQDPQVRGSLSGDDLRLRSSLTGTDIRSLRARGRFSGSRLELASFRGTAPNGGAVSGSGTIDLSDIGGGRGPGIDLRIAARNAEILEREGLGATVTGPLRIVSNGFGGTIAGRLEVLEANWALGGSEAVQRLPDIQVTEVNLPEDRRQLVGSSSPWRFLIDASAPLGGIDVDGLGLDSEWRGDIVLRGTPENPRIGGAVEVVRGSYSFAGTRFELTRGNIDFDENEPVNPRLDLIASSDVQGLAVDVVITGFAQQPEIEFRSTPALPEEELLARVLFGGSITDLSATDALQLGAALASLRGGGGGLDPINSLRTAIGLDRLRIVSADPALDRGTAIALGKRLGRRIYVEIITDGQGYTATELEYQVTNWLALLASVSTIGRESVAAEYRRDY